MHNPWQTGVSQARPSGFYINGEPNPPELRSSHAEESGLVDRKVRCENCQWGGPSTYKCRFFMGLNERLPDIFDLDEQIEPKGCCNAQLPGEA